METLNEQPKPQDLQDKAPAEFLGVDEDGFAVYHLNFDL